MPRGIGDRDIIPSVKKEVIQRLAHGESPLVIAPDLNICKKTVYNIKNNNKDKIEKEAQRYLDALPDIVEHDLSEIKDYKIISEKLRDALKNEKDTENLKALQEYCSYIDKRITDIKRSVGLYSSTAPSLVFQQLNVISKGNHELLPVIQQLLGGDKKEDDIIDVETVTDGADKL